MQVHISIEPFQGERPNLTSIPGVLPRAKLSNTFGRKCSWCGSSSTIPHIANSYEIDKHDDLNGYVLNRK